MKADFGVCQCGWTGWATVVPCPFPVFFRHSFVKMPCSIRFAVPKRGYVKRSFSTLWQIVKLKKR